MKTVIVFLLGAFLGASYPVITKNLFSDASDYVQKTAPEMVQSAKEKKDNLAREGKEKAVEIGTDAINRNTNGVIDKIKAEKRLKETQAEQ